MTLTAIQNMIVQAALSAGVDPGIALGVAQVESGSNPNTRDGAAGEIGIFQIMPSTAPGVNLRDPNTNIQTGVGYLASLLSEFGGDYNQALAAYNWGPGNVAASGGAFPGSVVNYVNAVMSAASSFSGSLPASSSLLGAGAPLIATGTLAQILPSTPMGYAAWAVGGFLLLSLVID